MGQLCAFSIGRNIAAAIRRGSARPSPMPTAYGGSLMTRNGTAKWASRLWLGGFDGLNILLSAAGTTEAVCAMSVRLAGFFCGCRCSAGRPSAARSLRCEVASCAGLRRLMGEQRRGSVGVRQLSMSSAKQRIPGLRRTHASRYPAGPAAGPPSDTDAAQQSAVSGVVTIQGRLAVGPLLFPGCP